MWMMMGMSNETKDIIDFKHSCWAAFMTTSMVLFILASPTLAQAYYEVKNPTISPDFGYEDFFYSASIGISGDNTDVSGKFKVELKIYDGENLLRSESSPERRFNQEEIMGRLSEPFTFGPIDFEKDFGISETDNASFEFIVYKNSGTVASERRRGPIVYMPKPIITYNQNPYFFQPLSVSISIEDMEGLSPSCHLEMSGPIEGEVESWTTSEVPCTPTGAVYSCTISEDMSKYRDGGNFSFSVVYSNLKLDPIVRGPYSFSVRPYSPSIELLDIPPKLDYNNFSIRLYVKDEGRYIVGGTAVGSGTNLTITHPERETITSERVTSRIEGNYLVFEWDTSDMEFNRGDVELSKREPFKISAEYENERWSYEATSEKSFEVVEEVPILEASYDPIIYVRTGSELKEKITATVQYSKGRGDLLLNLDGPDISLEESKSGSSLGGDRYLYEWEITFDEWHANHNYTLTFTYLHPDLEDGAYDEFEEGDIRVLPVFINFVNVSVDPGLGCWNDSYHYTTLINSSLDMDVALEIYNPCEREWMGLASKKVFSGESWTSWNATPFKYECSEMAGEFSKYRFKAVFRDVAYASRAYPGPRFSGGAPNLTSLEYREILYVPEGGEADQVVKAVVDCAAGMGEMALDISGPDMDFETIALGQSLGGDQYLYEMHAPFDWSSVNKSYTLSLTYIHPSIDKGRVSFENASMGVLPLSVELNDPKVTPAIGRWNETFTYSVEVDSDEEMMVTLQTYNPCDRDWTDWRTQSSSGPLIWSISPFRYECSEMTGETPKYRFKAEFEGTEYRSEVISGPALEEGAASLVGWDYLPVIYVPEGGVARQVVGATVRSPAGMGELELAITGEDMNFSEVGQVSPMGEDAYRYDWSVPFDERSIGNNYTLVLTSRHPSADDRVFGVGTMLALPVFVEFKDPSVSPEAGLWNESYLYTVGLNASLGLDVLLQTYNPCSYEWVSWGTQWASPGESRLSWSVSPFRCDCAEMRQNSAKYRFKAVFREFEETSNPYTGPNLYAKPELADLSFDELLYVTEEADSYQVIKAIVEYPMGKGNLSIRISPKNFNGSKGGIDLGGSRYLYEWSVPFDEDDVGNHTISLTYEHPSIDGGRYDFESSKMTVVFEDVPGLEVPKLINLDYAPILFVDEKNETHQVVRAEVSSHQGRGALKLKLIGPDKEIADSIEGGDLGDGRYVYEWSESFSRTNVYNSYRISLAYALDEGLYDFGDRIMTVAPKEGDGTPQIWEPTLNLDYDRTLHIPMEGEAKEVISATILYPEGKGSLELTVPGKLGGDVKDGTDLDDGKYLYEWEIPFNRTDIGKSYAISLVYRHSTLPGGEYGFADRYMNVEASPEIARSLVEFSDPRVDPKNGSTFSTYTYCVDINTNLSSCDVELQTLDPGAAIWAPRGIAHYDGASKMLCWPDRKIDGDKDGLAKYRFVCGDYTSEDYEGPTIRSLNIAGRVEPYNGSLYITEPLEGIEDVYSYNYYVEIESLPDQEPMTVDLVIYDPVARSWIFAASQEYDPSQRWLNYTVNFAKLNFKEPFLGESKYRLVSDGRTLNEAVGPNVTVNFREESVERLSDGTFAYRANVRSSITPLDVYVYYTNDGRTWQRSSQKPVSEYSAPGQWQELEWRNMPRYQKLEFVADIGGII
jgi:hypothetical protein